MSQYITEDIFRAHLAKRGVRVELGTEPTYLEQDTDGVNVTVKKVDISNGIETTENIRAAYAIGADGARGTSSKHSEFSFVRILIPRLCPGFTRRAIGATYEGQTREEDGQVWADVEAEGIGSDVSLLRSSSKRYDTNCTAPIVLSLVAPAGTIHVSNDLCSMMVNHTVTVEATIHSISMRPKDDQGNFHVGIMGQGFDPADLVDQTRFVNFFYEKTGRKDIVFKRITALTYWK